MYDPLIDAYPSEPYVGSYWQQTTKAWQPSQLSSDLDVDVAIIGAGYTGLSAALQLSKTSNCRVAVLDAVAPGWGCAGRNAGFALAGSGRLSLAQMQKRWGGPIAHAVQTEYDNALTNLYKLIEEHRIDCDLTQGGYLRIAHTPAQSAQLQSLVSDTKVFVDADRLQREYLNAPFACGGLFQQASRGLNPSKLVLGLAHAAQQHGVSIYSNSPVTDWSVSGNRQCLITPGGNVMADKVVIASNAYSGKHLHCDIRNRQFPVLSSIIVTAPLSAEQQLALSMRSGLLVMDTRPMKYYYRLLPDGRLLFGGRGAVTGAKAQDVQYKEALRRALLQTLPGLEHIDVDYFWSGWVSISLDDHPRLWRNEARSVYTSMGYCGAGVSYACYSGKRLADWLLNNVALPALPIYDTPLPRFPFAWARRPALSLYYRYLGLKQAISSG